MHDNALDPSPPPQRQGMSCLVKIVIALVLGGGLSVVLCCGAVWYFASRAVVATDDPAKIEAIRRQIAQIEIPDDMPPIFGGEFNFGLFQMQMAGFGVQEGKVLMLMQMQVSGLSEEEMEQQFRRQAAQQQSDGVRIIRSETRTLTVDGEPHDFVFAEGTIQTKEGDEPIRQVSGAFPARGGHGFLMLLVPQEQWDEEEAVRIIESIRK